jgi:PPM family protein phosphatase
MKCEFFSLSDAGRVRDNNEDSVVVLADAGLAVLADGMGGYNAGEVASQLATQLVTQRLTHHLGSPCDWRYHLQHSLEQANLTIYEASLSRPDWRGMGTTVVAAIFNGARLTVGHVGDSRLYRLRQGQLTPLTRDHSVLQEQIDAGLVAPELAHSAPYRNLVTRAVGVAPQVAVELSEHVVQAGDTYLLCSDGLNDMLTDAQMASILKREPGLASAGRALLDAANDAGGKDNISLVLVQCSPAQWSLS